MDRMLITFMLILALQVSGCTTYYQYRSDGEVHGDNAEPKKAVLYWHGEEGRLWYGKKYKQLDSGLNFRICGVGVKSFDLSSRDRLEMPAKANDLRVADVDQMGQMLTINPPLRLKTGDYCGLILLDGQAVITEQLREDQEPLIAVLCKSVRNPERYPVTSIYQFGIINRHETSKGDRSGPDPCVVPL